MLDTVLATLIRVGRNSLLTHLSFRPFVEWFFSIDFVLGGLFFLFFFNLLAYYSFHLIICYLRVQACVVNRYI